MTGGTSHPFLCHSGTSYSAADRAGVKGVGVADEHENVTVSGPKFIAAKTWRQRGNLGVKQVCCYFC